MDAERMSRLEEKACYYVCAYKVEESTNVRTFRDQRSSGPRARGSNPANFALASIAEKSKEMVAPAS